MTTGEVALEFRRATECLQAADACRKTALYADAVSRAYYSIYHGATALIATQGLKAKSHRGLHMLFRANFLETGILESWWAQEMRKLYNCRINADYRPDIVFGRANATSAYESAVQFLASVQPLLSSTDLQRTDETPR